MCITGDAGAMVVLPFIHFKLAYTPIAAGVIIHAGIAGILQYIPLIEVSNFGRYNATAGFFVQCIYQLRHQVFCKLGIVVYQEK